MTNLRLRYQTMEFGDSDIHLCTLRDRQQFYDPDLVAEKLGISSAMWPIFGIVWPSSLVLARFMDHYKTGSLRILEVGCGIALPSLLLNAKHADITATDFHPEVETFLDRNTTINGDSPITFERTGWSDHNDTLGIFDLIIGSDLLYEDEHAGLLAGFINDHSRKKCEVIIVDPGRGKKSKLITAMKALDYINTYQTIPDEDKNAVEFKGSVLKFSRQ